MTSLIKWIKTIGLLFIYGGLIYLFADLSGIDPNVLVAWVALGLGCYIEANN